MAGSSIPPFCYAILLIYGNIDRSGLSVGNTRNFSLYYIGNKRYNETNGNSTYSYDANGNISSDALSGLEISYNLLNLPSVIYTEGDMGLYYAYLADGTKFAAASYAELYPVRYAGSLVYDDGSFESASFGGGRIVGTSTGSEVHYFQTDHLGSTRVVAKVTPTGRIDLDRKDYYPFGKEWTQSGMPTSDNRYTFSGKEQHQLRDQSIHYADFGARYYDPTGVIFIQQDPLMVKYYRIGQYSYCAGNPIRFADEDGRKIVDVKGQILYRNGQWTKAASGTDAMRVGISMMATPTGASVFNDMANSSTKIQIEISPEVKFGDDGTSLIRGDMEPGKATVSEYGDVNLLDAKITIFEGSINAELSGTVQTSDETSSLIKSLPSEIAVDGAIGSVGVHEGIHTTPKNVQQNYENTTRETTHNLEIEPIKVQNQYLKELNNK